MNFAVLYVAFQKKVGRIAHLGLMLYLLRVGLAAGVMGAAVWGARYGLESQFPGSSLGARAVVALVPLTVGVVVYGAGALAFRLTELRLLLRRGRR